MWVNLSTEQKQNIITQTAVKTGLPAYAVEKDGWVCILLQAIFQSQYAANIIFKGGTSLSKAYNIINRFSEDVDLIIDRKFLGFEALPSKMAVKRLRETSGSFIINDFRIELINQLSNLGVSPDIYTIKYNDKVDDTSDPNTLEVYYNPVIPNDNPYIQPRVLIEMGARSLTEPAEEREIVSFIDNEYAHLPFAQKPTIVKVVVPTRTFIEKVLLLHEEFSKPIEAIRSERLSRHLYDLDRLMDTEYAESAYKDKELFEHIVEHRKTITPLRNISYDNHNRDSLQIIPPDAIIKDWEQDYKVMQENMIIGDSKPFPVLLERMNVIMENFKNDLANDQVND
jgi:predicted nucleotidyltransferase component of viral defense system